MVIFYEEVVSKGICLCYVEFTWYIDALKRLDFVASNNRNLWAHSSGG